MLRFYDVSPVDLALGPPLPGRQGGCNVDVGYGQGRCRVQLPYMAALSPVRTHRDPYLKFTLDVSLEAEPGSAVADLRAWLAELDAHVRRQGLHNSQAWFGAACSDEEVDDMFCPVCRPSHLRLTMGTSAGQCAVPFFGSDATSQLQLEDVTAGSEVSCLVELDRVWMYNGRFGLKLKPLQCMARPGRSREAFAFRPETGQPAAPTPPVAAGPPTSARSCRPEGPPAASESMFRTEAA